MIMEEKEDEAGIIDLGALECIAIEDLHRAGRNRTKKSNFHLKDQLHSYKLTNTKYSFKF